MSTAETRDVREVSETLLRTAKVVANAEDARDLEAAARLLDVAAAPPAAVLAYSFETLTGRPVPEAEELLSFVQTTLLHMARIKPR